MDMGPHAVDLVRVQPIITPVIPLEQIARSLHNADCCSLSEARAYVEHKDHKPSENFRYYFGYAVEQEIGIAVIRRGQDWKARMPFFGVYKPFRKQGWGEAFLKAMYRQVTSEEYRLTGVPNTPQARSILERFGIKGVTKGEGLDSTILIDFSALPPQYLTRLTGTTFSDGTDEKK
jgi:hypothetical protein